MQDSKIKRMLKQSSAIYNGFERAYEINKRDAEHYNNISDEKKLEFATNARKQELYHKKQAELERQNNGDSGKAFYERWIDDLCDAGRMFVGKANDLLMDEDLADLDNVQQNIEAMKKIATYKKLINDRNVYQQKYDNAVQIHQKYNDQNVVSTIQDVSSKLADINNQIKELDNYFLGEGRNNPVVAEQMYDINKMSGLDMAYINYRSIMPESVTTFDDATPRSWGEWYKPITGVAGSVMDILKIGVGALTWGGEKIQQGAANVFGSDSMDGATTRRTLGKFNLNDEDDAKFINKLYKGSQLNVRDINNTIDDSIIGYIDDRGEYHGGKWLDAYNKQAGEIAESVAERMQFAKTGKIYGIDIYDQEDINPQFKEEHDHYGESNWDIIAHPLHAFAESASTVMSMRHQLGAMGVDAISSALAKRVPALAIASELASMGTHIAATEVSRNRETASEKINALSDRMLTDYVTNGGDLASLVNTLEDGLKHAGVNTEGLDSQQIVKLGVAYNIITNDKNFEKVKFESRKGINKLVNANNALAVMDYLQTLPFMSYGGKALNRFLGKKATGAADNAVVNKAMSELEKKYASTLSGMVDHYIDKAALKVFKNDVEKLLMTRSVGRYLTKKAKLGAFVGVSEGLEEAQQEILQSRFKSGAYDNYNRRESAFDLDEVINNFKLFREGVGFTLNSGTFLSSMLGIDPNDPLNGSQEIRKAFNVGMASSLIFGAGSHALTNITQYQSDDQRNITSLIKNIKDDAIIANIVGTNQKSAQDQQHIGIFYDAFDKGGMNAARLNERLNFLKETINSNRTLATKEDIDADKKLLNASWYMYSNPTINNLLKENKIKIGSREHKDIVIDGAKAIVDQNMTSELIKEQVAKVNSLQDKHLELIKEIFDKNTTSERLQEIQESNPLMFALVNKLGEKHTQYLQDRAKVRSEQKKQFKESIHNADEFANDKNIREYAKNNLVVDTENESDLEQAITDQLKEYYIDERRRNDIIDRAYIASLETQFKNNLRNNRKAFLSNRFIRSYARSVTTYAAQVESRIVNAYNDDNEREDALDYAWKLYNQGLTKEDYVSDGIHQLHLYQQQKALSYLSGLVKNRKARLKEIRRITGLDVNTDFLEGMVDAVDEMQKQHADRENTLYHNEERKKAGQKEIKYSDLFDDNDLFDDQEDYDTAIRDLFLNKAVHKPQTTIAQLYFSGRANPLDLKSALYGSEAEETEFDDLHTQLEEATKAQQTSTDLDKEATSAADAIKNRQSALKKSAWAAIKKRLDVAENRRKLARRIYEEDEIVTPYDFEQAADGNQSAQKKILNVSTDEASEAEQSLRKKYVGKKRETLDEKKEKVKKRKGKFEKAEAAEQDVAPSDKEDTIDVTESSESEEHVAPGHEIIVPEPTDDYIDIEGEDEIKSRIDEELKGGEFSNEYVKTYSDIRRYELTGESERINEVVTGSNPTSWCNPNWESIYPNYESGQVVAVMSADQFKQIDSTYESDEPVYVYVEITKNEKDGTTTVTPHFVKIGENKGQLQFFSQEPEMLPSRDDKSDTGKEKDDSSDTEPGINLGNEDDDSIIQPEPEEGLDVTASPEEDTHDVTASSDDSESVASFSESIIASAQEEENDQANANDDVVTNGSWIAVDYTDLQFDEDSKQLMFDGFALPEDQAKAVMTDLMLLGMAEVSAVIQEELPDGTVIKTIDKRLIATSENSSDLVSQTFFYQPDATDTIELKVGGKDVKLNKPIAPGSVLSKKLTEKDWLKNAKKYYIVTQSLQAENVKRGTDPRDAMTVAMVIEDDTNSYVVTLRALGTTVSDGKYTVNAETALRNWLYIKDIDFAKVTSGSIPESNKDKVELFKKVVGERAKEKAIAWWGIDHNPEEFEQWWKSGPMRSKYPKSAEDRYNADRAQREELLQKFWKDARQEFAKPGKQVISDEKIDEQINMLRQQRNAIIDAYLTKTESKNGIITYHFPKEVRTDVVPQEVVQSNGRINSQRDKYGNPIYHTVFPEDTSLEEIQSKIENNEVVFGYGHGIYGDKPFVITGVQNATEEYDGKGLSGKIYMMVEGPTGTTVPVMLQEERFDTQQTKSGKTIYLRNTNNLQLCLRMNAQTGFVEYDDTSDTLPSAAEVLFYMLTGRMDTGVSTDELRQEIVEFFLHTGPKTILKYGQKTSDANPLNFLASKQISWERSEEHGYVLNIAIPAERGYELRTFTEDELFNGSEEAQNNIRSIVQAIATQMHWNTDLSHMRSNINIESNDASGMSFFIRKMIELYGKDTEDVDEYLNQQINILGCPQLSFKVSDFYEKADDADETGYALKAKENVSIFAWMLKNKKVMSDVGEQPFIAPFVFGNGVANSGGPSTQTFEKVAEEASATSKTDPVILTSPQLESATTDFDLFDQAKYNDFTGGLAQGQEDAYKRKGWYVAKTEEQRKKVLEKLDQSKDAKDNGGINDRIMLRPPKDKMNPAKIKQYVEDQISEFLKKYNERYPDRKVDKDNIIIKDIVFDQIKAQYANRNYVIILDLYKNGTGKVTIRRFTEMSQWNSPVTGIFSKEKGKGKIDVAKARKWLQSVLGLQEHQVVVTDALLRSMQNDIVYGVTTTSFDKIIQETVGQITISSQSGLGVEYHEAWHYVNLLLHDNETRQSIYDSYRASHKNLRKKGVTNRDIEEAMAEDFRRYMLMQEDDSITGKIRRFFNNILDMLIASRKEGYRTAYQAIQRGEYKGLQLDKNSLDQFKSAWKNEAPLEYFVSGVDEETSKNLTNIATHHELFEATDAIVNEILSNLNLDSIEKIRKYSGTKFDDLLDIVDELIGRQADEHSIEILTTIRNNPEIIRRKLIEHMMDLGIRAKVKKMSDVIQNDHIDLGEDPDPEALGTGEQETNKWDILDLTVSKKDNAALRTKMFLRAIPKCHIEYYSDGTREYIDDFSNYGVPKYVPFDEAWNKILNELWSCTSFDKKINGEYSKNSIMGRATSLAESDPFFYSLKEKLESLNYGEGGGDVQLKSQIFTTISSNKNPVAYVQIENARRFQSAGMIDDAFITSEVEYELDDNGVESDRHRIWRLMNDTTIQVARNVPRKWSKAAAANGLLDFNRKTGKSVVSKQYAKVVQKQYDDVVKELNKYDKKKGIKSKIIAMLNTLGVPIDLQSFDVFVRSFDSNKDLTPLQELEQIRKLIITTAAGTIGGIVTHISQCAGDEEFAPMGRGKYVRAIDEVFNNYDEKSQIGKLALAYNYIHPQLSEYTVKDPKGNRLYPINMANETTDKTNALNDRESGIAKDMRKSLYCRHSIILDAADAVNENDPSSNITLNTFVGLKDGNSENGTDYFGVTALEDYLCKMFMTESDQLVFPTMADKKTWYSLTLGNSKLSHDTILCGPIDKDLNARIYEAYEKENPYSEDKYKSKSSWQRAAKRWYYSLSHDNATRQSIYDAAEHDLQNRKNANVKYLRFGDVTIDRFCGYFLDELNSLIQYYSKENIQALVEDANKRKVNFHGKVKNGRMDFSGNGGKFRYFYGINLNTTSIFGNVDASRTLNLNQQIEALFKIQQQIEAGKLVSLTTNKSGETVADDMYNNVPIGVLQNKNEEGPLDGFELVRAYLKNLRTQILKNNKYSSELKDAINDHLIQCARKELQMMSRPGDPLQICRYDQKTGRYLPTSIPSQLFDRYVEQFGEEGLTSDYGIYEKTGDDFANEAAASHALFSLVANHVANSMTSVIEIEKIYAGDPAFYKEKKNGTETIEIESFQLGGSTFNATVQVEDLWDIYSDKIKRLGGLLSPGGKLRLDYSQDELNRDPNLFSSHYTNLNVEDIEVSSIFLKQIEGQFRTQLIIDYIRSNNPNEFKSFIKELQEGRDRKNAKLKEQGKKQLPKITYEGAIDILYSNEKYANRFYELVKNKPFGNSTVEKNIERNLQQQLSPYRRNVDNNEDGINVADAQVFIRPELYRKMRIALGDWSFEPDPETGYCDEEAYRLIESSDDWMKNKDTYQLVRKFQLYVLKMSYFQNKPTHITPNSNVNLPIYNKMAIFPLFKFHASTEVGHMLYERMNRKGEELDMVSFKSAVKVGAVQKAARVITEQDGTPSEEQTAEALSKLNDQLNKHSNNSINYATDQININGAEDTLAVEIQDLRNIRLQLNTRAHEAEARAIGTQMFKIAFSNIIDDAMYGQRTGKQVKEDIIRCINKLTNLGVNELRQRFFKNGKLNDEEVENFIMQIVKNNGLGSSAQDIITNGGVAAGLMTRQVFENSISAIVNSEVVDITTNGGTAIQQSIFGFVGHDRSEIAKDGQKYRCYNGGQELKWIAEKNSVEILLTMNFFKSVIPEKEQTSYEHMRQWLIDHDVIKGLKSKEYWKVSEEDFYKDQLLQNKVAEMNFSVSTLKALENNGIVTLKDLIDNKYKLNIDRRVGKDIMSELDNFLKSVNLGWDTDTDIKAKKTYSNPKPFGIGYRIPTQGMSSMFSFTVADVLPEQVGDLIVVPREFTAQTGSDKQY